MQELEKILEEINEEIKSSIAFSSVFTDGLCRARNIIRKHLSRENAPEITRSSRDNDDWIPVEERLPIIPDNLDDDDCPEFNVTIKGANRATTLRCASDGTWFDEFGHIYPVIAWRLLPEPYCPERSENEKG